MKKADLNKDGLITWEECLICHKNEYDNIVDEDIKKSLQKKCVEMFEKMDANHDGKLTREELVQFYTSYFE